MAVHPPNRLLRYLAPFLLAFVCDVIADRVVRNMLTYNSSAETLMQNVVVHGRSQEVFVGGRNKILRFSKDLTLLAASSTGPTEDHIECLHPLSFVPCQRKTVLHNDDNKVLLIFPDGGRDLLLTCGSLYRGMCLVRPVNNININHKFVGNFNETISLIAGNGSTVAFFGPGVSSNSLSLYSATTYDGRPLEYTSASVSSKVLVQGRIDFRFEYSHSSETARTAVNFDPRFKRLYKVNYIYGFSHGNYSYFLTTQQMSIESEQVETRLARVCNKDPQFFSYAELALRCHRGLDLYNLATAGYLGVAGNQLKRRLKLDEVVDVLYVSFVTTVPQHGYMPDRSKGSVVCSFPMSQVVSFFTNATKDCFEGEPRTRLLQHIVGLDIKCSKHPDIPIDDGYCGSGYNHYIEGREEIPGGVRSHVDHYVTSLAVTLQMGKTVALLGTDKGRVIKVMLERRIGQPLYVIDISSSVSSSRAVQKSVAFDNNHDNIYLLTGNKVVKFPIGSCSVYEVCGTCLMTEDPLSCGWCGSYCAHQEECETPANFSRSACPPTIERFYPTEGPIEGGTSVVIIGSNFGSAQEGEWSLNIQITVAGSKCTVVQWESEKLVCKTDSNVNEVSGPVVVTVTDLSWTTGQFDVNGTAISSRNFSYVRPQIYGLFPPFGPVSGGTLVTIYGKNLFVGRSQKISVAGVECESTVITPDIAHCTTDKLPKNSTMTIGTVEMTVDGSLVVEPRAKLGKDYFNAGIRREFEYRPDPEILEISPKATTVSGSTNLTVSGVNLNSVLHPKIVVLVTSPLTGDQMDITKACRVNDSSGTLMVCPTPSVEDLDLPPPTDRVPIVAHVIFVMDGVQKLRELHLNNRDLSQLLYYPDPEYLPFKNDVVVIRSDQSKLEIKGKNLNLAHTPSDITILINDEKICNVTRLSKDSVFCQLPSIERLTHEDAPEQTVEVFAGSLHFKLGAVRFVEAKDNPSANPENPSSEESGVSYTYAYIAGVVALVFIVVVCYFCYRKLRKSPKGLRYLVSFSERTEGDNEANSCRRRQELNDYQDRHGRPRDSSTSANLASCRPSAANADMGFVVDDDTMAMLESRDKLIYQDSLSLGKVIGEGYFGRVYKGVLRLPGKEETEVAVKTLHNNGDAIAQNANAFLQEGVMMKDLNHQNVLSLIGVCLESGGSPMVIIPYMKYGDLRSYVSDENRSFTSRDILNFGLDIAAGMRYLTDAKFVHRDLAARNCMLDANLAVKVADFGLSRDVYEREYYTSNNKSKLPIKWMALESLEKGTYNMKTDVWSFGVVMWELLTRGFVPYPDVDNWDMLRYLSLGRRMMQPLSCPDMLYAVMLRCWSPNPDDRPTFAELEIEIQEVMTNLEHIYRERLIGLNVTYVNYPATNTATSGSGNSIAPPMS